MDAEDGFQALGWSPAPGSLFVDLMEAWINNADTIMEAEARGAIAAECLVNMPAVLWCN